MNPLVLVTKQTAVVPKWVTLSLQRENAIDPHGHAIPCPSMPVGKFQNTSDTCSKYGSLFSCIASPNVIVNIDKAMMKSIG
jgi:hypothetical protein